MHFLPPSIKCSEAPPIFWLLRPVCQAHGNQIIEHFSDYGTVLSSSWKLEGAAEHLIDGSNKRICQLSF